MKRSVIAFAIFSLCLGLMPAQGTRIPTAPIASVRALANTSDTSAQIAALEARVKLQEAIAVDGIMVVVGGFGGIVAGDLVNQVLWQKSVNVVTVTPAHYALNPATGTIDLVPAASATSSQLQDTSPNGAMNNAWVKAGNAAIGAIISIGIYELGHSILHWW